MMNVALVTNFWVAFLASAILAKPVLNWIRKVNSRQTVSAHAPEAHQAKQGTPTMGGIIVAKGVNVALIVSWMMHPEAGWLHAGALFMFIGFTLIGFVDDFIVPRMMPGKRGLGWKQKFIMQVVLGCVGAFLLSGAKFDVTTAVVAFGIVFYSNAYNFSDGLDGLAGTILLGLGAGLVGLDLIAGRTLEAAVFAVPLLGAIIPFLFVNAPPAKVFMGDVGSLPIGALIGAGISRLAMNADTVRPQTLLFVNAPRKYHYYYFDTSHGIAGPVVWGAVAALSIVMFAELIPVPLQILSVKLRKKKLFPFTPIHHAFEKAGWAETRVMFAFALTQVLCSAAAIGILLCGIGVV